MLKDFASLSVKCSDAGVDDVVVVAVVVVERVLLSDNDGDDRGTLTWLVLDSLLLPAPSSIESSDAALGRGPSRRLAAIFNLDEILSISSPSSSLSSQTDCDGGIGGGLIWP